MLIDWFTVVAQTINFLVLVWLMKRYLYHPILRAIDAREQRIAMTLADAEAKQAIARQQQDEFLQKNALFDQERTALFNQVQLVAQEEKQRLLEQARQAADDFASNRMAALKNDAEQLNQLIARRTEQAVFSIARKTLADLASASLEQQITAVFIQRLQSLDPQSKALLAQAISTASEPALLRCTFELPAEQQMAIQQAINLCFASEVALRFEVASELLSGIEFSCNGQKLAWSIANYLGELEQGIDELIHRQRLPHD